jgi:heme-degrading monooxygenase HmoA
MTVQLEELDAHVTYAQQLERAEQTDGPVVLINIFSTEPGDSEAFLEAWREAATFMKRQPGYIAAQLHRGTASSGAFVNVAIWESAAAHAAAVSSPEIRAVAGRFPADIVSRPHLLQKVAVPGICVA